MKSIFIYSDSTDQKSINEVTILQNEINPLEEINVKFWILAESSGEIKVTLSTCVLFNMEQLGDSEYTIYTNPFNISVIDPFTLSVTKFPQYSEIFPTSFEVIGLLSDLTKEPFLQEEFLLILTMTCNGFTDVTISNILLEV